MNVSRSGDILKKNVGKKVQIYNAGTNMLIDLPQNYDHSIAKSMQHFTLIVTKSLI